MSIFRPKEIRAILVLSALVFIGSSLTLLKRQGRLSGLDLNLFLKDDRYYYSYHTKDLSKESESAEIQIENDKIESLGKEPGQTEIIDLNTADYFELQRLPGIGPVLAGRILAYRDSVGTFRSVDDLLNVNGIGRTKYMEIKNRVTAK